MSVWKQVTAIEDGQNVEASVINRPLSELAERTGYLRDAVESLGLDEARSSIRFEVELSDPSLAWPGAVVCMDPDTKKYVLARAQMSPFDAFSASSSCYSVGVLCSVDAQAGTGTAVSMGLMDLSGQEFDLSSMVESGEKFRNGVYFLSSREDGRITAFPTGPRVQIGVFAGNAQAGSAIGDFAVVSIQYGDLASHVHRSYGLAARPAGNPTVVSDLSGTSGTVYADGYLPDAARALDSNGQTDLGQGDVLPRLRLDGTWPGADTRAAYEITLSGSSSSDSEPSSFPVYLRWTSSDPEEGSGFAEVGGFYREAAIGLKGLVASLEPEPVHVSGMAPDIGTLYSVSDDSRDKRTWTVSMPEYARGWRPNDVDASADVDGAGSVFRIHGVVDRNVGDMSAHFPGRVFELVGSVGNPYDGDILSVYGGDGSSESFLFYSSGTDPDTVDAGDGVKLVPIAGSAFDTFAYAASISDADGLLMAYDRVSGKVYVGASSVSYTHGGAASSLDPERSRESGEGVLAMVAGRSGESLLESGWAVLSGASDPVLLECGPMAYFESLVDGGDGVLWKSAELETCGGCPGAAFRYSIGMDPALNSHYPPAPVGSGYMVVNGVGKTQEGDRPDFRAGQDTLYWFSGSIGGTPWPASYIDPETDIGSPWSYRETFHFVSMLSGDVGPVTSVRPAQGSPVKVYRCGTRDPASTGDLELDLDLVTEVLDGGVSGYKAVKAGRGGRLLLGPVVERIVAGPGLQISSLHGQPDGQGTVTLSMSNATYSGDAETVALENAKEEMVGMFPYIRMLGWDANSDRNVDTGFVARFHVPYGIPDVPYGVRLYATVFGEDSFSGGLEERMAGLRMTYSILPNWSPNGPQDASMNVRSDIISPDEDQIVEIPFGVPSGGSYSYKAFDPVVVHNDTSLVDVEGRCRRTLGDSSLPSADDCSGYLELHPGMREGFGVRPGYIVSVRLSRSAPRDGSVPYTGRIGFTNLRWSLVDMRDEPSQPQDSPVDCEDVLRRLQKVASQVRESDVSTSNEVKRVLLSIVEQLK